MNTLFVEKINIVCWPILGNIISMFSYPCFRFPQFPDMYISFMAGQLVSAAVEAEMALSQLFLKILL